jgi:hypothetical protein
MIGGLGRNPNTEDTRDWSPKRLAALIETGQAVPVTWNDPVVLSQGSTPHCVGFFGAGWKATAQYNCGPDSTITNEEGHRLYYASKIKDGQPGMENGSCSRSLAQVLKDEGVIDNYAIGYSYLEAKEWVEKYGCVGLGIPWYTGMDATDSAGMIHVRGTFRGGHEIMMHGVYHPDLENVLRNSWNGWGFQSSGDCGISDADLEISVDREGGDVLYMVKLVKPVPVPVPDPFPDLEGLDAEGVAAITWCVQRGYVLGYADGTFRPWQPLLRRHVFLIAGRAGLAPVGQGWIDDYTPALRGDVRDQWPSFQWNRTDWDQQITRSQLCRLLYRGVEPAAEGGYHV